MNGLPLGIWSGQAWCDFPRNVTADANNRLLDDDTLRKRMGEAGREMTAEGMLSVKKRNDSLARFLDMAIEEK
jgi:hypothetical protein